MPGFLFVALPVKNSWTTSKLKIVNTLEAVTDPPIKVRAVKSKGC